MNHITLADAWLDFAHGAAICPSNGCGHTVESHDAGYQDPVTGLDGPKLVQAFCQDCYPGEITECTIPEYQFVKIDGGNGNGAFQGTQGMMLALNGQLAML